MSSRRWLSGIALGAFIAAGVAVAPALGAPEKAEARLARTAPLANIREFGAFTPAAADPRLAAVFARGGLDTSGFSFTPAESRHSVRAVTVAVRARSSQTALAADRAASASAAPASVSLTPVAYSLGAAIGWRRFALSGDMAKVDMGGAPGSREAMDVGVSYTAKRFTGQVKAGADRPLANAPLVDQGPTYSVDVGGAYRLTRNLDVTAGVRYKSERDRLTRFADTSDHRDSQAVYIGTAFRF